MAQYISKSALVAEIEKIRAKWFGINNDFADGQKVALTNVLSIINTLEMKEVDLEKEIELVKGDYEQVDVAWNNDFDFIARHFFELGLKTQRSSISIPNIDDIFEGDGIDPNSKEAKVFKESYYMTLERFKAQKGE